MPPPGQQPRGHVQHPHSLTKTTAKRILIPKTRHTPDVLCPRTPCLISLNSLPTAHGPTACTPRSTPLLGPGPGR